MMSGEGPSESVGYAKAISTLYLRATGNWGPETDASDIESAFSDLVERADLALVPFVLNIIENPPPYMVEEGVTGTDAWKFNVAEYLAACGRRQPEKLFESLRAAYHDCGDREILIWSAFVCDARRALDFCEWLISVRDSTDSEIALMADLVSEMRVVEGVAFLEKLKNLPNVLPETATKIRDLLRFPCSRRSINEFDPSAFGRFFEEKMKPYRRMWGLDPPPPKV